MNLIQEINSQIELSLNTSNFQLIDERGDLRHFRIDIKAEGTKLEGLSRISQHKLIYEILDDYFKSNKLHALKINIT